jgi:hypothetical protein
MHRLNPVKGAVQNIQIKEGIVIMSPNPNQVDRLALAEASFNTVLDADKHEDEKAGRILSAMAFLTAAAAGAFAIAYSPGPSTEQLQQTLTQSLSQYVTATQLPSAVNSIVQNLSKPQLTIFGVNMPLIIFSAYIFFVLLGATLYLSALGPSLNIPSWFRSGSTRVNSLLFFKSIAALEKEAWSDHWIKHSTAEQLHEEMLSNYIDESRLIAQKAYAKVILMSIGSLFFKISILLFIILMASLFSPSSVLTWRYLLLGLFGLSLVFAFASRTTPPQESHRSAIIFTIGAALCLIGFVVLLFIQG